MQNSSSTPSIVAPPQAPRPSALAEPLATAAEQKQIRDTLCAIVVRGLHYPTELADARVRLSREFAQLRADSVKPKAKS